MTTPISVKTNRVKSLKQIADHFARLASEERKELQFAKIDGRKNEHRVAMNVYEYAAELLRRTVIEP